MEGESIEQYITAICTLVETREYGTLTEKILRDRIIVGIQDQGLSARLQAFPDLMLDKVKREMRQREAVKEQH